MQKKVVEIKPAERQAILEERRRLHDVAVGAEYEVQFALDSSNALQAYLYSVTPDGVMHTGLDEAAVLAHARAWEAR